MTITSTGDLSHGMALRTRNAELRQALARLQTELTTGQVSDPVARLDGHMSYLSRIESDLARAETYGTNAREVQLVAGTMQTALSRIGEVTDDLVGTLALTATSAGAGDVSNVAADARGALETLVSALNSSAGGRQVFSGTRVKTAPLPPAETILAELSTVISAAGGPADARALARDFFNAPGGGFETLIYRGATDGLAPVRLGAGEAAKIDLRADHAAFRETMMHVALAALSDGAALSLDATGRHAILEGARDGLLAGREAQIALQADLGVTEERIDKAKSRIESEMTTLRMARHDLLKVDPYEAATELEAVQTRLETLYEVTARASRLSLSNFLS
ncbi:flagellin [Roseovarius salis]|uniref:flagellin n=1 Tax=Roseovarius salis TaxID=3376063 RepID=UPI0037C640BB